VLSAGLWLDRFMAHATSAVQLTAYGQRRIEKIAAVVWGKAAEPKPTPAKTSCTHYSSEQTGKASSVSLRTH
jgi:hypothetical protein